MSVRDVRIVVVNDASALIDLRKGNLLGLLAHLPYRFVIPLVIRVDELVHFNDGELAVLDAAAEVFDLPGEKVEEALRLMAENPGLSAHDSICMVSSECFAGSILLTGDGQLRGVASRRNREVHGVLWVVDQLHDNGICEPSKLIETLTIWRADKSVRIADALIVERLKKLCR